MLGIGPMEMVIILLVALLVLGPRRLPEMLKTIGKVMAELRRTADEVRDELMFDEEIREIKRTVHDMQDLSTTAVDRIIKEGERELALEELGESEQGQGTERADGSGESGEAGEQEKEAGRG